MNIDPQQAIAQLSAELRAYEARDNSDQRWVFDREANTLIATSDGCTVPLDSYGELRFKRAGAIRRRLPAYHYNEYNILEGQVVFRFSKPDERGSMWMWFVCDDGTPSMISSIALRDSGYDYEIVSPFQAQGDR